MIFTIRVLLLNHPHIIINCCLILSSSLLPIYSDLLCNKFNELIYACRSCVYSDEGIWTFPALLKLTVAYTKDTHRKKSLLIHKNCSCKYLPFPLIKLEKYRTMFILMKIIKKTLWCGREEGEIFQVIIDSCVYLNDFLFISVLFCWVYHIEQFASHYS
jgi:hypothetical protein